MATAEDFRIRIGYVDHPKTIKLIRRCGPEAFRCHVRLIQYCTITPKRTEGDLSGMGTDDIEIAAGWAGEAGAFVEALAPAESGGVGFLDGEPGAFRMHDWAEHQPWVAGSKARSDAARNAANARWRKPPDPAMPNDAGRTGGQSPLPYLSDPDPSDPFPSDRSITAGALVAQMQTWPGWPPFIDGGRWGKLAADLSPFAQELIDRARAQAEQVQGKPNFGLLIRIIERLQSQQPEQRRHPKAGTDWAKGRASEDRERHQRHDPPLPLSAEEPEFEVGGEGWEAAQKLIASIGRPIDPDEPEADEAKTKKGARSNGPA